MFVQCLTKNKCHVYFYYCCQREAIRYAVAVGGDSDTIGAIVGSIAEALWGIPEEILEKALTYLPAEMEAVFALFNHKVNAK